MPPTVPINHYYGPQKPTKQNQSPILLFQLMYSKALARFEHSNFFKVNDPNPTTSQ